MAAFDIVFGKPWCNGCAQPLVHSVPSDSWTCQKCFSTTAGLLIQDDLDRRRCQSKLELPPLMGEKEINDLDVPFWKKILAGFGFPIEEVRYGTKRYPVISFVYVFSLVVLALPNFQTWSDYFWLAPRDPGRYFGLNLVSYSLLHSGLFHLFSNLLFVLPYLDNVEDDLGHGRFFLLLTTSAAAASGLHLFLDPSGTSLVGASGVCFGVMTYYCLRHPTNRFTAFVPILGWFSKNFQYRAPAIAFFAVFTVQEFLGLTDEMRGIGRVSHLSHLGGAGAGVIFWLIQRRKYQCGEGP